MWNKTLGWNLKPFVLDEREERRQIGKVSFNTRCTYEETAIVNVVKIHLGIGYPCKRQNWQNLSKISWKMRWRWERGEAANWKSFNEYKIYEETGIVTVIELSLTWNCHCHWIQDLWWRDCDGQCCKIQMGIKYVFRISL